MCNLQGGITTPNADEDHPDDRTASQSRCEIHENESEFVEMFIQNMMHVEFPFFPQISGGTDMFPDDELDIPGAEVPERDVDSFF